MQSIIVEQFGVTLGKTSERLVVRGPRPSLEVIDGGPQLLLPIDLPPRATLRLVTSDGERTPAPPIRRLREPDGRTHHKKSPEQIELPLFRVNEIVIASRGVSLSTDLVQACCERGIRLSFLDRTGKPYAMLSSPMLSATVVTRRRQLAAFTDKRGVEIAKAIVNGKLRNQAALLKYFGKYLKTAHPEAFATIAPAIRAIEAARRGVSRVEAETIDSARSALLALEGAAARYYWDGFRTLIGNHPQFTSRDHRGATDPVNSALNYGYGILYTQVWGALINAGLEPFAGFLHVDRPGKPSLVLDLIEEFRQPIVDRAIVATVTKGTGVETRKGLLTDPSRKAVASAVLERLESQVTFKGRRLRLKSIIQIQARNLAAFLRGDRPYRTFAFKW